MMNNNLTDEQLDQLNESFYIINDRSSVDDDEYMLSEMAMMAIAELRSTRKEIELLKEDLALRLADNKLYRVAFENADAELQECRKAAAPVYQWREAFEDGARWDDCTKEQFDGFCKDQDCETRILYAAPQLVPNEWTIFNAVSFIAEYQPPSHEEAALFAWNACRATMLQRGASNG